MAEGTVTGEFLSRDTKFQYLVNTTQTHQGTWYLMESGDISVVKDGHRDLRLMRRAARHTPAMRHFDGVRCEWIQLKLPRNKKIKLSHFVIFLRIRIRVHPVSPEDAPKEVPCMGVTMVRHGLSKSRIVAEHTVVPPGMIVKRSSFVPIRDTNISV